MFPFIILLSALFLAACAALFSVTGISHLFAGASISAGAMATSLEIAKLVSVSFLYRYHKEIPKFLRVYMWAGVVTLMLITSIGIYGYLAGAYAVSSVEVQSRANQITLYRSQQQTIEDNIIRLSTRSTQLQNMRIQQENRVDEYMRLGKPTGLQQNIIRSQDAEIKKNQTEITALSKTKDSLSFLITNATNSIGTTGKIGTFYYISQAMGVPLDTIVKWFILVLVCVFDPMSISLFLAYNVITKKSSSYVSSLNLTEVAGTSPKREIPIQSSEIAHNESLSEIIPNDIIKSNTIPYYMHPEFDWESDLRWTSDPAAIGYRQHLGVSPPKPST